MVERTVDDEVGTATGKGAVVPVVDGDGAGTPWSEVTRRVPTAMTAIAASTVGQRRRRRGAADELGVRCGVGSDSTRSFGRRPNLTSSRS